MTIKASPIHLFLFFMATFAPFPQLVPYRVELNGPLWYCSAMKKNGIRFSYQHGEIYVEDIGPLANNEIKKRIIGINQPLLDGMSGVLARITIEDIEKGDYVNCGVYVDDVANDDAWWLRSSKLEAWNIDPDLVMSHDTMSASFRYRMWDNIMKHERIRNMFEGYEFYKDYRWEFADFGFDGLALRHHAHHYSDPVYIIKDEEEFNKLGITEKTYTEWKIKQLLKKDKENQDEIKEYKEKLEKLS